MAYKGWIVVPKGNPPVADHYGSAILFPTLDDALSECSTFATREECYPVVALRKKRGPKPKVEV